LVKELNATDLSIRQPLRGGGSFLLICGETTVTCTGVDAQGQPLPWGWEAVGGARQKAAVQTVSSDRVAYRISGVDYQLRLAPDAGFCQQLESGAIRFQANRAGKLVLLLGGS
jgi:hypothetical protein